MFQPLKALNHFTIERVLGRGGMGIVYLATDTRLARAVALKVLDVYDTPNQDKKDRFLHEAQAAAAIRHPNVATIYEIGETPDGTPYIAMEYCQGQTLSQLLRRGAVDGPKFLDIARQIADGVAAAHRNGVVHRDIKSANIVLQDDESIKILDFGLAKRFDSDVARADTARYTSTGSSFFGTLPYISPEQAQGLAADRRSDLFSVGVVLFELATSKLPFDDESPLVVLEKIRDAEPSPFTPADPKFPVDGAAVISKLLQKSPDDRYQTSDELASDLVQIAREQTTAQTPKSGGSTKTLSFGRTVRRPRARKAWGWAVALGTILLVAAAGVLWSRRASFPNGSGTVPPTAIRSLAVLPFRNVSGNATDSFLSIGFADALVTRLQQGSTLNVRPTSAVVEYQKETEIDAKAAGAHLQVEGVLEGRFLSSGNIVRVNLQLTDVRTGYGIWASSIDGDRADLITLMDKVSNQTSQALTQRLGMESTRRDHSEPHTANPEAYENFLKGRALIGSLLPEDTNQQVANLLRAVQLDPNFAAAYADLAVALVLRNVRGFSSNPRDFTDAERYARLAVRLDPNLSTAHLALGRTLVRDPARFRESVRENLAALRLNPNDTQSLYTLATYFVATGEPEKANCVADLMGRIDPTSNDVRARGYFNLNGVDPEGALRYANAALAFRETALAGHDIKGLAYLIQGDINAAEQEQVEATRILPDHYYGKSLRAMIAAARGDRGAMESALASFRNDAEKNHWAAARVSLCYAKIGDRAKAIEWIRRSSQLGNHSWYYFVKHPWNRELQSDSEFQQVLTRMKADLDDVRDDEIGIYQLVCRDAHPSA